MASKGLKIEEFTSKQVNTPYSKSYAFGNWMLKGISTPTNYPNMWIVSIRK